MLAIYQDFLYNNIGYLCSAFDLFLFQKRKIYKNTVTVSTVRCIDIYGRKHFINIHRCGYCGELVDFGNKLFVRNAGCSRTINGKDVLLDGGILC